MRLIFSMASELLEKMCFYECIPKLILRMPIEYPGTCRTAN